MQNSIVSPNTKLNLFINFKDLHIVDSALVDMEAEGCPHQMEALNPGSSGIDYQHIALLVPNNLQDVRMAADENVWLVAVNQLKCIPVVFPGIAADVCHKDLHPLALEKTVDGMFVAEVEIVAISRHTHQRLELGNDRSKGEPSPKIAGMPYLVDRFEEVAKWSVKNSVGVRYQSYVHFS